MENSKNVVITGGSSGIGLASAVYFAKRGWTVGLISRGETALNAAKAELGALGASAHIAMADVSDEDALERAASELEGAMGPPDVWVNNAGIGFYGNFSDIPSAAFRRVIDVNMFGTINGTRSALARMRPRRQGTIVQILSAISFRGTPLQTAYSTSKYGLRGFTEALRSELVHERSAIHVTMVHPPAVNTPFYSHAGSVMDLSPRPPPPVYQPEIVAEAIYFAATSKRRDWRVTGSSVGISVANKIAPGFLDLVAGRLGMGAQQTSRSDVADRRDVNTFAPGLKPQGTHGPFDSESLKHSAEWRLSRSPLPVKMGLGLLALGLLRSATRRT